jgi:hypothetical protein
MADTGEIPFSARPDSSRPGGDHAAAATAGSTSRLLLTAAAVFAVLVAGSALVGLLAGYIWTAVAPHALVVTTGGGAADVVNPETSAFIAADGWFAALCALGGAACGLAGWALAVRRHGVPAVLGLLGGGVAAALAARWIGQRSGQAAFNHLLAVSRPDTVLRAPLSLGAHGAIAFWPLAAGLVVGGVEAAGLLRGRRLGAAVAAGPAIGPAEPAVPDGADGW